MRRADVERGVFRCLHVGHPYISQSASRAVDVRLFVPLVRATPRPNYKSLRGGVTHSVKQNPRNG